MLLHWTLELHSSNYLYGVNKDPFASSLPPRLSKSLTVLPYTRQWAITRISKDRKRFHHKNANLTLATIICNRQRENQPWSTVFLLPCSSLPQLLPLRRSRPVHWRNWRRATMNHSKAKGKSISECVTCAVSCFYCTHLSCFILIHRNEPAAFTKLHNFYHF